MKIFKCSIVLVMVLILGCQVLPLLPDGNGGTFCNLATLGLILVLAGLLYLCFDRLERERLEQSRISRDFLEVSNVNYFVRFATIMLAGF